MPSIFSKRRSVDAGTTANGPAGVVRAKPAEAAHVRAKRSVDANVNHQLDRNGSDVSAAGTSGGGGDRSSGDMAGTATGTDTGVQGEREGGRVNGDRESEAAAVSSNAMAPRSPPPSAYPGAGVDKTPTKERRGSKIKSFLRGSFSEKDTNSAHDPASPTSAGGGGTGLKQRLTSPSTIFKRASISEPQASPTTSSRSQVQATPTASPPNTASNRLSAALFPENFSLSSTNSPESPRNGNRQSWQPSYPLVIPDNAAESGAYADVAPDGSLPPKQLDRTLPMPMPTSAPGVSENELRRSMKAAKRNDASGAAPAQGMTTSGETGTAPVDTPGLLNSWEPLKPDVQKPSSTDGAVASADVSTTVGQRSISAAQNTSPTEPNDVQSPAQASSQSPKPVLSLDLGPSLSRTLPDTASPARANAISTSPTSTSHSPIAAFSPAYTPGIGAPGTPISPIPGMIVGPNGKLRPAIISRKTTHIHSPPMPQPIKNLPTLSGLPGFSMPPSAIGAEGQGQRTPAGMPKTPGWGGFGFGMGGGTPGAGAMAGTNGPLTGSGAPRTPGGGFPWAMGLGGGEKKDKGKQAMSEEELRKMKRAMPVMLRQASTKPVQEEGGDVGADDDDDNDDESESEADDTKAGDSEDEDEPAGTASTSAAAKAKSKGKAKEKDKSKSSGLSALDRLKGKRAVSTSSPLKIGTVQEEDSTVPGSSPGLAAGAGAAAVKPPKTSPSLFERRASKSPQLASGAFPPPQASPPLADVPEGKVVAGEEEPKWSIGDKPKTQSIWTRFGTPGGKTPAAASSGGMDEGGYFGSQPSSSNATAQATPAMASTTAKGKGRAVDNQTLSPPRTDVPLDTPSDIGSRVGEDSEDEGEGTEEGGPTATTTSTSVRSTTSPSARPGLYTQASQSLVNLRPRASMEGNEINDAPTLGAKPPLITIPSGEEIGTRAGPPKIEMPKGPFSMIGRVPQTPMWAKPPPTPATPGGAAKVFWAKGGKDQGQLKRRRSADDLTGVPPTYTPPGPGVYVPRPREDEGREKLPGYWCAVHIEGSLSRKMEFSAPGVQSRDRSWKKYYFILRGTSLFVYKFDPHRFPVKDIGVGANVVISDVPEVESEEHLHVHVPPEQRRNSVSGSSVNSLAATAAANARRASMSMSTDASGVRRPSVGTIGPQGQGAGVVVSGERRGSVASIGRDRSGSIGGASGSGLGLELGGRRGSGAGLPPPSTSSGSSTLVGTVPAPGEKDSALFTGTPKPKAPATAPPPSTSATTNALAHFQTNHLVRQYTLQNAESGLAADYVKRKNVVRVRSEGEQFLLQTDGAREVVDWIEAFQAATNVSLDLDDRPMPKIITLPRRRRRRPAGAASGTATPARADGANPDTADTEAGNVAAVEAAERAARERDRDLAQDQGTAERATG